MGSTHCFKKWCSRLLTLTVLFSPSLTFSAVQPPHHFEAGTKISYFKYEEPGVMEEDGIFYGIFGEYTYRSLDSARVENWQDFWARYKNNAVYRIYSSLSFGEVDYTSTSTGPVDDIEDFMFEIRGTTGYDLPINDSFRITPYFGLAYRYLNDDSAGKVTTTGHAGYERESNYFYLPFGVETHSVLDNDWSLGLNLEYDWFVGGKQKSHLEDVSPTLNTVENDQDEGYGVRGSVKLAKESRKFNVMLEPYVIYWHVDDSNTSVITCGGIACARGYEPENEALEIGAKFGLQF